MFDSFKTTAQDKNKPLYTNDNITFVSKNGRVFSSKQIDSLKGIGYFVGMNYSKTPTNSGHSEKIYFYDKAKYKNEGIYCGNTERLPLSSILRLFPYNQTETIKLVSFKHDSSNNYLLPKSKGGIVDKTRLFETRILKNDLVTDLIEVLANFKFDTTEVKDVQNEVAFWKIAFSHVGR